MATGQEALAVNQIEVEFEELSSCWIDICKLNALAPETACGSSHDERLEVKVGKDVKSKLEWDGHGG